jgi:hypothetical protein
MGATSEFCGIDPDEMGRLAGVLATGSDRLAAFHQEVDRRLREHGIHAPALREIADIAEWGRGQVPMLRERARLIRALNADPGLGASAEPGMLRLPDRLADYERAQSLARMYGQDIFVNFSGEFQGKLVHAHIKEIERLAENPHAAAAFFALLPPKIRDNLPTLIASTGSPTAKEDVAAFGKALGAALRSPVLVPAFGKVKSDLLRPAPNRPVAWNRLALLRHADAPSDVRSAAARALVLDDFVRTPYQEWRAAGTGEAKALGLPADLVSLGLEILAGDGAAARDAFSRMGGDDVKLTQVDKMRRFLAYARWSGHGDDIADAFGRVIEAGAEVHTEKPGRHSPPAAAFALDAMKAAGTFGDTIPEHARDSMATLAKSYIHELASGARFDKAVHRESGMTVPEHWKHLPGVTPSFYLSPGDTYRFLRTFVGDEALTNDFDSAAARFRRDTLAQAARADAVSDENHFGRIAQMLGDLATLEFKAAIDVRGERDATDDLIRSFIKNTASLGIDSIPVAGELIKAGWDATKAYVISAQLDGWVERFETGVEQATGARSNFVLRQKYDLAHILHSAGYPADDPPSELISKTTGRLKTYDELLSEAKREADASGQTWEQVLRKKLTPYEIWLDRNEKLDAKVEDAATAQSSERPKEEIRIWN